jgi:alpha-beta hydrolase superfamily lysophospholipase
VELQCKFISYRRLPNGCVSCAVLHFLASKGVAAVSYDAAGHGDSEPTGGPWRYAVRSFDHLLDDAFQHLADVVGPFMEQHNCAGGKIFLMGSSMGGLVVRYVQAPICALRPHCSVGDKP